MTKKSKSFDQQDKKRLLAIAKEILVAFADGAVKRGDKVSSIAANTLGMSFFAGFFVNFTETFVDERRKFTTLAAKMLKAKAAHENTIDNFCLKAGQEYLQQLAVATDGVQVSVEGVAQGLVDKVLDEAGREYTYIAPNFLIRHAGADIITLGRVRSMPTELAKTNTKLLLNPQIKFEVRLGLDQQLSRTEIVLNMPPSVWVVEVPATKENVEEEAKWLIDIASSLMRLSASKWAQMWPEVGKPEQHPTLTPQFTISTVTMEDDSAFAGGIKLPNVYEANHEVVGELASPSTQSRAAALFDATKGSLAQRVAHGLGWMSRGRQATDRAERLLFFFTALEALLSWDENRAPVTQTISRHASIIYTQDLKMRVEVFKKIKVLYAMRSQTVHSGIREVLGEDVTVLQFIAENIFWNVLNSCNLKMKHTAFSESLADASHGLPWEFAKAND